MSASKKGQIAMKTPAIQYPVPALFSLQENLDAFDTHDFVWKAILAALAGASIPAIVFYFLM